MPTYPVIGIGQPEFVIVPRMRGHVFMALTLATFGCVSVEETPSSVSVGLPFDGFLRKGVAIATNSALKLARPQDKTRYGLPELASAIEAAADSVQEKHGAAIPLRVGDLASPQGGAHPRHKSHRSGRDADIMFYVLNEKGKPVNDRAHAYDQFGVAVQARNLPLRVFDVERNWTFVRSLLTNPHIRVQWIFVSKGVKSLLLDYAIQAERDPEVIAQAMWILHQPSNGRSHNDHFHVRIACGPKQRALGCVDTEPYWPWWRDDFEKGTEAMPVLSDERITDLFDDNSDEP